MANKLNLWISPETGRLLANSRSFVQAQPNNFYFGNSIDLELHQMRGVGVSTVPYETDFPAGSTIKVAIGTIGKPTAGTWTLTVDGDTTSALDFDATPAEVETALNALASVTADGGVSVSALGLGYSITWDTVGTKPAIVAGSDTLVPSSYEAIYTVQTGSASQQEIVFVELRTSPLAIAESFSAIGAPVVTATIVSPWNGTNKVIRTKIDPTPKDGFFTMSDGTKTVVLQAYGSSGEYSAALSLAGMDIDEVSQSGALQFDFSFSSDVTITVDGSGLIESPGKIGTLNLGTTEVIAFLGSESSKNAIIEITVESSSQIQTLVQVPCVISSGVLLSGAVSPVQVGVMLTEAVANARFIRRDASQSPSAADLDIIWPNLGVSLDGSDVADALSASNAPASGNAFATISDIPSLSGYLTITSAASTYQTISGMSSYLTTSSASSTYQTIAGMSSYQTVAGMSSYLTTASAASTYALLSSFNQSLKTTDTVSFNSVSASTLTGPWSSGGANPVSIDASGITFSDNSFQSTAFKTDWTGSYQFLDIGCGDPISGYTYITGTGIQFPDLTTQNTRVVREIQANGSGFSTGGFDTTHYPSEVKVIDDTGTAYWVPARLA